ALRNGGEVRGQEGIRQLPGDHRLRHDLPLRVGGNGRGLGRSDLFWRRLDAEVPQYLPLERTGRVGDVGILAEQRHEPGVPDGGRRQDGRDAVQAPELLSPMTVASARRPDAGTLIPQQQGDGLELRAHGGRHAAALGSRLDLTGVSGKHRHDIAVVADASLIPRGGTASAGLVEPKTSPLVCRGTVAAAACRSPATGAMNVPGNGPDAMNAEPNRGSPRSAQRAPAGLSLSPGTPTGGLMTTARRSRHRRPVRFSGASPILTRAKAHHSRPLPSNGDGQDDAGSSHDSNKVTRLGSAKDRIWRMPWPVTVSTQMP